VFCGHVTSASQSEHKQFVYKNIYLIYFCFKVTELCTKHNNLVMKLAVVPDVFTGAIVNNCLRHDAII